MKFVPQKLPQKEPKSPQDTDQLVALRSVVGRFAWLPMVVMASVLTVPNLASANTADASEDDVVVATSVLAQSVQDFADDFGRQTQPNATTQPSDTHHANLPPTTTNHQEIGTQVISADSLVLNQAVIDEAHVLSRQQREYLTEQLMQIHTNNLAQAAVVIVPSTGQVPIFDYAMAISERWQLGSAKADDGLLIVVAVADRKVQIVTGYGLEGVLPDVVLKRIIRDDITPSFRHGEYAQGLSSGIARITERLSADPQTLAKMDKAAQADEGMGDDFSLLGVFIFACIAGSILSSVLGRVLGASVTALGAGVLMTYAVGLWVALPMALVIWVVLLILGSRKFTGFRGGSGGISSGGFGGGSFGGSSGGFGSGGFGSGGFGGGGGSFGGGGAGGSW